MIPVELARLSPSSERVVGRSPSAASTWSSAPRDDEPEQRDENADEDAGSAARSPAARGIAARARASTPGRIAAAMMNARNRSATRSAASRARARSTTMRAGDERSRARGPLGRVLASHRHAAAVLPDRAPVRTSALLPVRTCVRSLEWSATWPPTSWSSTGPASTTSRTSPSGCRGTPSSASPASPARASPRLAFDTIYAEGQRRYVERLSAYARQFLQMMEKPDVDSIDGPLAGDLDRPEDDLAQPALDGRHRDRDLRLPAPALRARRPAALPGLRAPDRGAEPRPDRRADPRAAGGHEVHGQRAGRARPQGRVPRRARGAARRRLHAREGRRRAAAARGGDRPRQEVQAHDRGRGRPARAEARPAPAADAVGRDGGGARGGARRGRRGRRREPMSFSARSSPAPSTASRCPSCSRASSRSTRRTAPARAAPASARSTRSTPTCSSRTRRSRSATARSCPWSVGNGGFYESVIQAICDRYEIDLDTPWRDLTTEQQDLFLYGTERRPALRPVPQPDGPAALVHDGVRGHRRLARSAATSETDSSQQRERIEEYMSFRPCPHLQGRAAEAGGARGHGRREVDQRVHADVGDALARLPRRARADRRRSS